MHSMPTTCPHASATKSIALKHKLPLHLRRPATATAQPPRAASPSSTAATHSPVDHDLLATVLRVHLEAKQRRERQRNAALHPSYVSAKARVLQRAVHGVDEPAVQRCLSTTQGQYGFDDALAQLSRVVRN